MKFRYLAVLLFAAVVCGKPASAQVAAYGEFTSTYLSGGPQASFVYGGTGGVLLDGPKLGPLQGAFDVHGTFVNSNGEGMNALLMGPRVSIRPLFFRLAPFAQFNVGFGRYHDNSVSGTTNNIYGAEGGVTRRISPRLDAVLDYSYSWYGYNFGYYSPQAFSAGFIYHFVKR